jgi:hypothetical protein
LEEKMKKVVLGVVGFAALAVTSCNMIFKGSGEKKPEEAPPAATSEQHAPEHGTEPAATPAATENALANVWQAACTPASVVGLTNSRNTVALSPASTFEKNEQFFTAGCDTPAAMTYKVTGTYANLGQNPSNPAMHNVDFTVNTATLTVTNAATVEKMNAEKFCDISDWAIDRETDITGKSCAGFTVQKGDVVMDVMQVEGSTAHFGQKFTFGSAHAATRPEAVVTDAPYTKS